MTQAERLQPPNSSVEEWGRAHVTRYVIYRGATTGVGPAASTNPRASSVERFLEEAIQRVLGEQAWARASRQP